MRLRTLIYSPYLVVLPNMINEKQNLSLQLDIQWHDNLVSYRDRYFLLKTNFWRDSYPAVLDYQLKRAELNQTIIVDYKAGDLLLEEFTRSNLKTIPLSQFNQYFQGPISIVPTVGRFYPRGMIEGVAGCFKLDDRPFRIVAKTDNSLDIDLNHPLSYFPIKLTATITDIFDANQQNGGRCNDVAEIITINGPGLQTFLTGHSNSNTDGKNIHPTNFFAGMPFSRKIEDDDALFYTAVESKPPVDRVAIEQLKQFYSEHLNSLSSTGNCKILDLMAGPDSYLPGSNLTKSVESVEVTGLGLKEDDLKANKALNKTLLHDVNKTPELPFEDKQFDAVICSFAIEYMIQPQQVFQHLARILKPGGQLIIAFSDRYFEKKVISLWEDVHSFERMGIVLEYFQQSNAFENLSSESIRGLIKQDGDPFVSKNVYSCPLFIISGNKKGS